MNQFNLLYKTLLENNTIGTALGAAAISGATYNGEDNRPIEPAKIVIGAKKVKSKKRNKSNQQFVPIQRRAPIESIYLASK